MEKNVKAIVLILSLLIAMFAHAAHAQNDAGEIGQAIGEENTVIGYPALKKGGIPCSKKIPGDPCGPHAAAPYQRGCSKSQGCRSG